MNAREFEIAYVPCCYNGEAYFYFCFHWNGNLIPLNFTSLNFHLNFFRAPLLPGFYS